MHPSSTKRKFYKSGDNYGIYLDTDKFTKLMTEWITMKVHQALKSILTERLCAHEADEIN